MARTQGSGFGAGIVLWQLCPLCGKKKALFDPLVHIVGSIPIFKCTSCKKRFNSETLIKTKFIPKH